MHVDPVTKSFIRDVARRESRSDADALRTLVAEAVAHRRGKPNTAPAADFDPFIDGQVIRKGGTVASHLPATIKHLVERVAEREGRSLSSMFKVLLRESLSARGELPAVKHQGNDPVLPANR
jgi:hypothetical protein